MTGGHGIRVCQFGTEHGRCRCMKNQTVRIVCPTPEVCGREAYVPKHRKDVESRHE